MIKPKFKTTNFIYIFFALLFLSAGSLFLYKNPNTANAENIESIVVDNSSVPDWIVKNEYIHTSIADTINPNGFINDDIFMFYTEAENSTLFTLSFATNGSGTEETSIYNYVYYPNIEDKTNFQFYFNTHVKLAINGQEQNLNNKNFIDSYNGSFTNLSKVNPEKFAISFGSEDGDNQICVTQEDENGNVSVKEGMYTLDISLALYTCHDGKEDLLEEEFTSENLVGEKSIKYSFYVVDRNNYFNTNRPKIEYGAFDDSVVTLDAAAQTAYELYSNYSSKGTTPTDAYKIPYVDVDYTRFDVEITKEFSNTIVAASVNFDVDTKAPVVSGSNIINIKTLSNNICRIYFTDVGVYNLNLKAIYTNPTEKYALTGFYNATKKVMVTLFGFQACYTNFDGQADANNNLPIEELKDYNFTAGEFASGTNFGNTNVASADITSGFLNSNSAFSQDNIGMITPTRVVNYVNGLPAVAKTNQTPLSFVNDANLNVADSFVLSTKNLSGSQATSYSLNGSTLYQKAFSGRAENEDGKYIYVIFYTCNNYYNTSKEFCQIFYFEINKANPKIEIKTGNNSSNGETIFSNIFVNQDVTIFNTTKADVYSKDVTVQIYAQDYINGGYYAEFGGEYGISMERFIEDNADTVLVQAHTDNGSLTLKANAKYTIGLFYTSELKNSHISNIDEAKSQQTFTIDKVEIENLKGRNVTETSNGYQILNDMRSFSTNQSMALSWKPKQSGAKSYAKYKFFPLLGTPYYSQTISDSGVSANNGLIWDMLSGQEHGAVLPVDFYLDMGANNGWIALAGNTNEGGNTYSFADKSNVSSEFLLHISQAGLYLVDVYDDAGNHTIQTFLLDSTNPYFAIYNSNTGYSLTSSSMYINQTSTLHWADYKAIYMSNLASSNLFGTSITDAAALPENQLFKDQYGNTNIAIFNTLNNLFMQNNMQYLTSDGAVNSGSSVITSYTSMYLTLQINDVVYYADNNTNGYVTLDQAKDMGVNVSESGNSIEIEVITDPNNQENNTKEKTIRVLIRDQSNTKEDLSLNNPNAQVQYTNFFSAKQTLEISFDDSEFEIAYMQGSNMEKLSSMEADEGSIEINGQKHNTKTTYLTTRLNKAFYVTFLPTIKEEDGTIKSQIESVSVKYYRFITQTTTVNGKTYFYKTLSAEPSTYDIYTFAKHGIDDKKWNDDRSKLQISAGVTEEGKYEITRTYKIDGDYTYNARDYYKRTYTLLVDRNDVISAPETVENDGSTHSESLVGGDIFVAMFDNGKNASLVVTLPNAESGSTDSASLYNNTLTTNKLPVNLYIPQYKYTTYVTQESSQNANTNYHYQVNYTAPIDDSEELSKDINFKDNGTLVKEYALYAQIATGGTTFDNSAVFATSAFRNATNPSIEDIATDENGFMKFYRFDGSEVGSLTEAGTYFVRIYQGRFGLEGAVNESYSDFSFTLQSATPDFTAQNYDGTTLVSENVTGQAYTQKYYTNKPYITLTWAASTDKYMVEIDETAIKLATQNRPMGYGTFDDIWYKDETPQLQDNHTYSATVDLSKMLDVYQTGGWVNITMQFKNHDQSNGIYSKVTKQIYVDLAAPSTNIQNLVLKSTQGSEITLLTESTLRTYNKAIGGKTQDLNETSYNLSNSEHEIFKDYCYMVDETFLYQLRYNEEYASYVRKIENRYAIGESETLPEKFLKSNFTAITDNSLTKLDVNTYYEVVETDRAGNMTIYTVFVVDYASQNDLFTYQDVAKDGTLRENAYSSTQYNQVISHPNAIHNIFARTGFSLKNINYFGDDWAQIHLTTYNGRGDPVQQTLMLSPHYPGYVWSFVNGKAPERKTLASLLQNTGAEYKNCLTIKNRQKGVAENQESFYINIKNAPDLSAELTKVQDEEYIQFNLPTDAQLQDTLRPTTFLTKLTIYLDGTTIIYNGESALGYANGFANNDYFTVSVNSALSTITFKLNENMGILPNSRILYEYQDNYQNRQQKVHLYRETVILQNVTSQNDLYSYHTEDGDLYYITSNGIRYTYNPNNCDVKVLSVLNGNISNSLTNATYTVDTNSNNTKTITVNTDVLDADMDGFKDENYNSTFVFEIRDHATGNFIENVYFKLYNQLPIPLISSTTQNATFRLLDASGKNITKDIIYGSNLDEAGYFSEVRILYTNKDTFIPVKFYVSTNKLDWQEVASGTRLKNNSDQLQTYYLKVWYEESLLNVGGNPMYVFGKVPASQVYQFNLSSLSTTYWVEKTVGGVTSIVQKSNTPFISGGLQYNNHYIVNCNPSAVEIKLNKEQQITKVLVPNAFENDDDVVHELWQITNRPFAGPNLPAFETSIVITYIPNTDQIVKMFYASNSDGLLENDNLIAKSNAAVVISQEKNSVDKVMLQWTAFHGYSQNQIDISIVKDGVKLNNAVYSKTTDGTLFNYTYLTYSGKYSISLFDQAGNVQKFNSGTSGQTDQFTFVFLKDVPFTVSYTNPISGEKETSLPVKQAVYNGEVTLNIDQKTQSEFYQMGGYPSIEVKKNGKIIETEFKDNETNFTFSAPGYYEVTFTATSNLTLKEIRKESYQFTILNPQEHKISYVFNPYGNYYVESVYKNGKDITDQLIKTLDVATIKVNQKEYLTQLPLSYLDEKTGDGVYQITINTNNSAISGTNACKFTFNLTINRGTAPLSISLAEGKSTTKAISVNFNQANVFAELGACTLRIVKQLDSGAIATTSSTNITATSTGEGSLTITENGTYYVQAVSPSGSLLFSYKVIKKAPMNAASIIAIVISAVVLVAIIFIIFKLRKRISVK